MWARGGENPINFNLIDPSVRSGFQQTRFLHFGTRQNRMQLKLISAQPRPTNLTNLLLIVLTCAADRAQEVQKGVFTKREDQNLNC